EGNDGAGGSDGTGGESPGGQGVAVEALTLPLARIGEEYEVELDPMPTGEDDAWISLGQLPEGLSLTTGDGVARIEGIPTAPGVYEFAVLFQGSDGSTAVRTYTLRVRTLAWFLYEREGRCYAVDLTAGVPQQDIPF